MQKKVILSLALAVALVAGLVFYAQPAPQPPLQLVYRLFQKNANDHLFTVNEAEAFNASKAWKLEGMPFYVWGGENIPDPVQIHRFYNPNNTDHLNTDNPTPPSGYSAEGPLGWISGSPNPGVLDPLFLAVHVNAGDSLITCSDQEVSNLLSASAWQIVKLVGYVHCRQP